MSRFAAGAVSSAAPAGTTLTAGTDGYYSGYAADLVGFFGSISAEPLVGQTLALLASYDSPASTDFVFSGDVTALLSGKSLIVNGTSFLLSSATQPPSATEIPGYTLTRWTSGAGPQFTNGVSYTISIA